MLFLSPAERKVLIFVGILILTGSLIRFLGLKSSDNAAQKVIPVSAYRQNIVNINQASLGQLTSLPGIGIKTAQRIEDYRARFGAFKTIEDLMKVVGIGEKKAARLKEYITFDVVQAAQD